jgi:hypothetical protein
MIIQRRRCERNSLMCHRHFLAAIAVLLASAGLAGCSPKGNPPTIAAPKGLTYATPAAVYSRGVAITPNAPSSTGGVIASYSVAPTLPDGLTLDAATGVISGKPAAVAAAAMFTVTGTNAAGSTTASLSITVIDLPVLSFTGATGVTGVVGMAMQVSPTTLTANDSPITACATKPSTPALPSGLSVDAATCVISGTPTASSPATAYTIVATNAAGDSPDATVTLTIGAGVPELSYQGATGTTGTFGVAMQVAPTTLTANGAAVTQCGPTADSPALPAGLSVDPTTCVISGTPTAASAAAQYTIVAASSAGSSAGATVTLTVNAAAPSLSYAGASGTTISAGNAMHVVPTTLDTNGGALVTCGVKSGTTALPSGLSVDPATCIISGTPSAALPATTFTIVAANAAGVSPDAPVTLTVAAVAPVLSYVGAPDTTVVAGTMLMVAPTTLNTNGSPLTGCAVSGSPAAPSWMAVDMATCVISGTPPAPFGPTAFSIVATNAGGNSQPAAVTLSAIATPTVPTLSYSGSAGTTGQVGVAMSIVPTTLNGNGDPITGCAISGSPALPSGFSINQMTCVVTGTPAAVMSGTSYTIVATNAVGASAPATLTLTFDDVPALSYAGSTGTTGIIGHPMSIAPTTLISNGSPVTGCGIEIGTTALPGTLTVDPSSCVISGTPDAAMSATTFSIVATNALGTSAAAQVTLTVNFPPPVLSYAGASGTSGFVGVPMSVAPTIFDARGATVSGCTASPDLPDGLLLSAQTCDISGTPNVRAPFASYTITLTTDGGMASASVALTVQAPASLSLPGTPYDFGTWSTTATTTTALEIVNNGDAPATNVQPTGPIGSGFDFAGGAYPGFGGSCGATIVAGTPCLVVIAFTPTQAMPYSGAIALGYNDGLTNTQVSATVTGTGTASASLSITDYPPYYYTNYGFPPDGPTFDYGQVGIGTPVDHTFVVTNNGGASATITGGVAPAQPFTWKDGQFPGTRGTCSGPLSAGSSCSVVVTFTAASGTSNSSFSVSYTGGDVGFVSRNIAGTGTAAAVLTIYDFSTGSGGLSEGASYSFGTIGVGQTSAHTFIVINSGGAAATGLTAGAESAPFSFPGGFPGGTPGTTAQNVNAVFCTDTLPVGAACAVMLEFAPLNPGPASGAVNIGFDGTLTASRPVSGSASSYALLSITENNGYSGVVFNYGTQPTDSTDSEVFIVSNSGAMPATNLVAAALPDGFAWSSSGVFPGGSGTWTDRNGNAYNWCDSTDALDPGDVCVISVDFVPTSPIAYQGAIAIAYGDGSGSTVTASRSIEGSATSLGLVTVSSCTDCGSGGNLDFGTVAAGATASQLLYVTNSGAVSVTLTDGGITGSGFAYASGFFPGGTGMINSDGTNYSFCGPAPYVLVPGSTCVVGVSYLAMATPGPASGAVTIDTASATSASVSESLTASSTNLAIVSLSDSAYGGGNHGGGIPTHDFGAVSVGTSSTAFFFLQNNGGTPTTIMDQGITGTGFSYVSGAFPGGAPGSSVSAYGRTYSFCPGTGGMLGSGQTCVIAIEYQAQGATTQAGSFSIGLTQATTPSVSYNLTGTPTSLAIVSISTCAGCFSGSETPTYDFGSTAAGTSPAVWLFVMNTGAAPATISDGGLSGAAFTYTGGVWPGGVPGAVTNAQSGTYPFCGGSGGVLPAGGTCVISVTYQASGSAQQTGSLHLNVQGATLNSLAYDLQGEPTSLAIVSISSCLDCGGGGSGTPTYDFGSVASGTSVQTYFYIRNSGTSPAMILNADVTGGAFNWSGGNFPGGVPGTAAPVQGSDQFCPALGGMLAGGGSCVVAVTYDASGSTQQNGSLSIGLAGATANSLDYDLQGEPTTLAIISLTDCDQCGSYGGQGTPTHDYGNVAAGTTAVAWFYLRNTGSADATITDGGVVGGAFSYAGGSFPGGSPGSPANGAGNGYSFCPTSGGTLASGTTCVLAIDYSASGSSPQTGSLSIALGGATSSSVAYNLRGEPTSLAIVSISTCPDCGGSGSGTPTYDFGSISEGNTATEYFFVTNSGASGANLSSPAISGTSFSWTGGAFPGGTMGAQVYMNGSWYNLCSPSGGFLAPGSTCAFSVSYQASGTSTQTGSLSVDVSGALQTSLAYNLQGEPTTLAIVSISDCATCEGSGGNPPIHDFGSVPSGSTDVALFFVRNAGASQATLTDNGISGGAFSYTSGSFPGGTPGSLLSQYSNNYAFCPASGGTLDPGATCVLSITYAASGTSQQTGSFSVGFGGATQSGEVYDLQGEPTDLAIVTLAQCPECGGQGSSQTYDFGNVASGSTFTTFFFLHNSGSGAATITDDGVTGTAFSYTSGTFPGGTPGTTANYQGNNYAFCQASGGTLPGGSTCIISIDYHASATSPQTGSLTIGIGGGTTTSAVYLLQGEPTTFAIVSLAQCQSCGSYGQGTPTYDFGTVAAGSTHTAFFYLSNTGASSATVTDGGISGTPFGYAGGSYPGGPPGHVLPGQQLSFCPASGGTLAPGQTCVIEVNYSASGDGQQTGSFTLNLSGATTTSVGFNLTGTSSTHAIVIVTTCVGCGSNGPPFDYGVAGTPLDSLFVVSNTGGAQAGLGDGGTLASPFIWTSGQFPGGSGMTNEFGPLSFCGQTLDAGQSCVISVRFDATAAGSGAVTLALTGATSPTASLALTGATTTRALLTISEDDGFFGCTDTTCGGQPADFYTNPVSSDSPRTFLVTNRGALPTTSLELGTPLNAPYYFSDMGMGTFPGGSGNAMFYSATYPYCTDVLDPGAQCLVTINFAPTVSGTFNAAINIAYSDSMGAISPNANRNVTGIAQ